MSKPYANLIQRYGVFGWAIVFLTVLFFGRSAQLNSAINLWMGILWVGSGLVWVWVLSRWGWQIQATPLDTGLIAIVCALALSAHFSLDPSRSWRMVWNLAACILVFYMAVTFLRTIQPAPQPVIIIYLCILGTMSFLVYFSLGQWMTEWYRAFGWELGIPRPPRAANYLSPNVLAILLNFGLLLGWGVWGNRTRPWWSWLIQISFFVLLLLTGSRSGWLGFLVGSLVLGAGNWWRQAQTSITFKQITWMVALLVLASVLFGILLVILRPDTLRVSDGLSILYRGEFWSIAWGMWQKRPWLGQGVDTFGTFFLLENHNAPPATIFRAAHSWWMSLLSETGLIGVSAAVTCWVLLGRWLWQHRQPHHWTPLSLALLAALAAFTVHATFDTPENLIFFMAAIWLAMLITRINPTPAPIPSAWRIGWTVPVWAVLLLTGAWVYPATWQYEQGLAAAEAGDWLTAADYFTAAQTRTPYTDTGIALAEALTQGQLAAVDPAYLPSAIAAYEQLIAREPGWPTNYANLAALHWQAGEPQLAITLMEKAHAIAPNISLYLLNLGLWHESLGEYSAASSAYHQLSALPDTWATPAFWQFNPTRQSAAPFLSPDPAWLALANQDWETAERLYTEHLQEDPYDGGAYLGLGIRHLLMGNDTAATQAFTRAQLLKHGQANLWLFTQTEPTLPFLEYFRYHSTFGLGQGRILVYPILFFNRPTLPYDLLPQLQCFSLDETTSQHLSLLRTWPPVQNSLLQTLLDTTNQGLVPCASVDSKR